MAQTTTDRRAPMAAAPMKYRDDGSADWGNMWDSFCVLALDGGPPHRGSMLYAREAVRHDSPEYAAVVAEITRGIALVSGLEATPATPGWIAVHCPDAAMAAWLSEAIAGENVQARSEGATLFVPAADDFSLTGEIKNVITAVAKTTHYWHDHVPPAMKQTLAMQLRLEGWAGKLRRLVQRPRPQR